MLDYFNKQTNNNNNKKKPNKWTHTQNVIRGVKEKKEKPWFIPTIETEKEV